MFHQGWRRSTVGGTAGATANSPAPMASSMRQSRSVSRDGTRLQMRCVTGMADASWRVRRGLMAGPFVAFVAFFAVVALAAALPVVRRVVAIEISPHVVARPSRPACFLEDGRGCRDTSSRRAKRHGCLTGTGGGYRAVVACSKGATMPEIGYFLSSEEHGPAAL